jgi:tetraacyldisaccharide 4'-kinase
MLPLVPLYLAGAAFRWAGAKPSRLTRPVLSVGNVSVGGTGKTPFVIALAQLLGSQGISVDVLSRGYGRVSSSAERVDPDGSAEQFGDEPLLIARKAQVPVFVAARRFEAGTLAEQVPEAQLHLLDDGFQHRQLYRDIDIVIVNSEDLNDSVLPAGNLREPLSALRRASVFAVSSGDDAAVERIRQLGLSQPIWRFRREMLVPQVNGHVVAFCGIARPDQFFNGLEEAGVVLEARKVFSDHHRFTAKDGELLQGLVRQTGTVAFITTEKDQVNLGSLAAMISVPLLTAGLSVVFEDESGTIEWLRTRLEL